jgi:hypothetical protein
MATELYCNIGTVLYNNRSPKQDSKEKLVLCKKKVTTLPHLSVPSYLIFILQISTSPYINLYKSFNFHLHYIHT